MAASPNLLPWFETARLRAPPHHEVDRVSRDKSILPFRLEPEHVLAVHAAGGVPIDADVRGGGVGVTPDALERMIEEQPLPARGEEQLIDRLNQQPGAQGPGATA